MNRSIRSALLLAAALALAACATYSVRSGTVLDGRDAQVQLRGVNWFGFETPAHLAGGLWARNYRELIAEMKSKGINAVRLPVCGGTLANAPILPETLNLTLNPELAGLDTLALLDRVVGELDRQGLYILLDLHTPACTDISPLWKTADYPESQWLDDLRALARRYRGLRHVIGIDLKNEPHDEATWGTGNVDTDWNLAAERGAAAVLAVAPGWLIFVEGIQGNPACSSTDDHFWGENLEPLACTPLRIPADRLVLSPHTYGPDVGKRPAFDAADFPRNLPAIWERAFGRFHQQGYSVILGEFGGFYGEGDPRDVAWQNALVAYLNTKGIRSGFYWTLNPNSKDTGGLLRDDWTTWREDKLALLHRFWSGTAVLPVVGPLLPPLPAPVATPPPLPASVPTPPGAAPDPAPVAATPPSATAPAAVPTAPTPAAAVATAGGGTRLAVTSSVDNDWGKGYCLRFVVRNDAAAEADWQVDVPLDGRITTLWRGRWTQDGRVIHVRGEDYNRALKPGESTDFGFCASRE